MAMASKRLEPKKLRGTRTVAWSVERAEYTDKADSSRQQRQQPKVELNCRVKFKQKRERERGLKADEQVQL